jgi:hemoglobin
MRDRWLRHMRDAVDSLEHLTPAQAQELWSYMERAAYSMVNRLDGPAGAARGLQL